MNTTNSQVQAPKPVKKELTITFFLCILTIDFLFYSQNWGVNSLILCLISIPLFGFIDKSNFVNGKWLLAAGIWLLTAIGIFVTGHSIAVLCYFLSFMFFSSVSHNSKLSIPLGITQTLQATIIGFNDFFLVAASAFRKPKKDNNKIFIHSLMVIIPLILALAFLKLYQASDPEFYELTKFINLNWISWGFLFTLLLLSFFLYGFLRFNRSQEIDQLEENAKNETPLDYSDRIQNFFGIQNESKIAHIVLISLNILLLAYIIIDFQFIFVGMHSPERTSTLSEIVHKGVDAQIASIILVILIVTALTRGQLNFQKNPSLKILIMIWLGLNVIMIINSGIKNLVYVSSWGFTFKRAGVFVYLFLAFLGIIITAIKVIQKKSVWYLLRTTSIAYALCLSSLLTFSWSRAIAAYNTSYVAPEKVDFDYLYQLGPEAYPFILDHHSKYGRVDNELLLHIKEDIPKVISELQYERAQNSWMSWVWSDHKLHSELKTYQFNLH